MEVCGQLMGQSQWGREEIGDGWMWVLSHLRDPAQWLLPCRASELPGSFPKPVPRALTLGAWGRSPGISCIEAELLPAPPLTLLPRLILLSNLCSVLAFG